jgi:hypothetical protein
MKREIIIGPSFKDLRPIRGAVDSQFPIFNNLEGILAGERVEDPLTGEPFDRDAVARYVCAVLSAWVYSDLETVATIMTRLGLERCRGRSIEISNTASLVRSVGYLIQSWDRKVALLAYRGTDPFDLSTWAVNADLNPSTVIWPTKPTRSPTGQSDSAAQTSAPSGGFNPVAAVGALVGSLGEHAGSTLRDIAQATESVAERVGLGEPARVAGRGLNALGKLAQLGGELPAATLGSIVSPERKPEFIKRDSAHVHAGFYRNQRATWFDLAKALSLAIDSGDIFRVSESKGLEPRTYTDEPQERKDPPASNKLAHLYITGHSQGAAMAVIAAFRIATEPEYKRLKERLHHVYAFAPPTVGNKLFATTLNAVLEDKVSCFVYRKDVVPHLPPLLDRSLEFTHVGKFFEVPASETKSADECHWSGAKELPERATSAGQLLLAFTAAFGENLDLALALLSILRFQIAERSLGGLFGKLFEDRRYVLYDHLPVHYVAVSQLPNRKHITELGGDF